MPVTVTCPSCASSLSLPDNATGPFTCPKCRAPVVAPKVAQSPAPAGRGLGENMLVLRGCLWGVVILATVIVLVWSLASKSPDDPQAGTELLVRLSRAATGCLVLATGCLVLLAVFVIAVALDRILRINKDR